MYLIYTRTCGCRIYWMNPLQYAQKAILINEFSGGDSLFFTSQCVLLLASLPQIELGRSCDNVSKLPLLTSGLAELFVCV